MSVRGERMPSKETLLGIFDRSAKTTMANARRAMAPVVAANTPRGRTGTLQRELRPRTQRTKTGVALVVAARRGRPHGRYSTVAQVVRWVNRGTGAQRQGPGSKAPITPKQPWRSLILPGGRHFKSVQGQKANPFMGRIRAAGNPRVRRLMQAGAVEAARRAEKEID